MAHHHCPHNDLLVFYKPDSVLKPTINRAQVVVIPLRRSLLTALSDRPEDLTLAALKRLPI